MKCECSDTGCSVHKGQAECPVTGLHPAQDEHDSSPNYGVYLYRIDMDDRTGTFMCGQCATDALESGLFTTIFDEEEEISDED